jgi:hypothetical protein
MKVKHRGFLFERTALLIGHISLYETEHGIEPDVPHIIETGYLPFNIVSDYQIRSQGLSSPKTFSTFINMKVLNTFRADDLICGSRTPDPYNPGYFRCSTVSGNTLRVAAMDQLSLSKDFLLPLRQSVAVGLQPRVNPSFWFFGDIDEFADRAYQKIKPSLNSAFSLLNFIYELKDLKPLWKEYFKNKGAFKKCFSILKNSRHMKLRQLWKELATVHLEWSFGIKPFISDLQSIYKTLKSLKKNCKEITDHAGLVENRHYSSQIPFPGSSELNGTISRFPIMENTSDVDLSGISVSYVITLSQIDKGEHATCRYSYSVPYLSEFESTVGKYLDAFGVSFDAAIIWNAIPFSFVVDWFINVGEWLHSRRHDMYQCIVTLWDFCVSQKYIVTVTFTASGFDEFGSPKTLSLGSIQQDTYVRWKLLPRSNRSLTFQWAGSTQLLLGSSLIGANGRKVH